MTISIALTVVSVATGMAAKIIIALANKDQNK